jgi:D-amino peptidase
MKIYISADIEGIWGVVSRKQTGGDSVDYQRARKLMTAEVNLVCENLWKNGATEILVNDSHGPMDNLLIEELDPKVSLISGYPKILSMMEGLDESFDAVMLIGYHPKGGSEKGIFDHTYAGREIRSLKLDGQEVGEIGLNARVAAHFGVPVILVSGDRKVCEDAKDEIGDIKTVAVKVALSRYCARNLPFDTMKETYRAAIKQAVASFGSRSLPRISKEPVVEVTFHQSIMAEVAESIPKVEKTGNNTIRYQASDMIDVYRVMRSAVTLASTVR